MNKNKIFLMNHTINRKKMYKSGKRWVVSSTLALLLLGGAEAINHTNTHAATNKPVTSIASDVQKPAKQLVHQIQSNQSSSSSTNSTTSKASTNQSIPASAPIYQTKPFNSAYQKYMAKMGSTDSNVAKLNTNITSNSSVNPKKPLIKDSANQIGQINPSDDHWIFNPNTNKYLSDNDVNWDNSGSFLGLTYKYSSELNAAEITHGTLQNNWSNGSNYAQLISDSNSNQFYPEKRPSDIANAQSIKFDTSVTLVPGAWNNTYDTRNMFSPDSHIYSLVIDSNFNTSNVTNMSDTFSGDYNLKYLALPDTFDTRNANVKNNIFSGNLSVITIRSPLTQTDNASGDLFHNMYQQLPIKDPKGNYYTLSTPNDFSKGNVGTFVATKNVKLPSKASPYGVIYLNQNKTEVGETTLNNLGYVGQTVNVEPQLAANVPQGYHLDNTNPIDVTLNNGGIINVNTSNGLSATPIHHDLFGSMLRDSPNATNNHVITVSGNPITYNGSVTLNFKANNQTIKSITEPYSVSTYTGNTVNLLNPSNYLNESNLMDNNGNSITINGTYFQPDSNNNVETITVQPSDAPYTSGNTKTNNSYVLNYNANNVNDNIIYELSGNNIPSNYQGQTGRLNGTSLNGVYDTNVPMSALNKDVPTNYHIVSGNNIRYDSKNHTVELAPDSENVKVIYTDQNGHTYTSSVNGQYNQKINDITTKYSLPNGYHVNDGQDKSYTFNGNQNQLKTLSITGNPASATINFINQNNNSAGSENVSGNVGNTVSPSSYPKGYEAPAIPTKYTFNKTGQNPDMNNVKLIGDIAGTINGSQNKNTPKNATTGYVTVHVVKKSTSGKILHKFNILISENSKRVGDSYTIKPSDTDVQPPYYDIDDGDNPLTGTVTNDGSLSNGQTTYNYTVHANDIEPISITIKNQNGHYINLNTGKLTGSANNATSTISDNTLAQLGGIGDAVDITTYINAPKGYHFNGDKSALEDSTGQKLDAIILEHKESGFGVMPLMLTMWTPTPNSTNSKKSNNPKTSSASNFNSAPTKSASNSNNIIIPNSSTSQNNSNILPSSAISLSTSSSALTNPVISIPTSTYSNKNNYISNPNINIQSASSNASNSTTETNSSITGATTNRSIPITTRNASLNKVSTLTRTSNLDKPLTFPIDFGLSEPTNNVITTPLVQSNSTNNTHNKLPQTNEINNYVDIVGVIISIMSLGIADIELRYHKFH